MKKTRVAVETVISHRIYVVGPDGERTLYAVADKVKEARALVRKAKIELGIAKGSALSEGVLQADPKK